MKKRKPEQYYFGVTARNYDQKRVKTKKWQAEQRIVESFLEEFSRPLDIIDIPVGTGRFFPSFSRRQDNVVGIDISPDMLDAAQQHPNAGACHLSLAIGDIFNLSYGAKTFDCAICIRFLNLVDSNRMMRALSALESTSRSYVIAGVRFIPRRDGQHFLVSFLFTAVRWSWLTFVKYPRGKVFFHTEKQVRAGIMNANLEVKKEIVIEDSPNGTRYVIFLLTPWRSPV